MSGWHERHDDEIWDGETHVALVPNASYRAQIIASQAEIERLRTALQKIVDMNVQYAIDRYGDATKADDMACVTTARAALGSKE